MALVNHQNPEVESFYILSDLEFEGGSRRALRKGCFETRECRSDWSSEGDGPVDAALEAVRRASGVKEAALVSYNISSVSEGSGCARPRSYHIDLSGRRFQGHATHTDVVVASALAFVGALNQASALMFAGGEIATAMKLEAQA